MKPEHLGMIIGGLMPAILFGIDGVSSKAGARTGMSWAPFVLVTGLAIAATGALALFFDGERRFTAAGAGYAALKGSVWAIGSMLVVVALNNLKTPLAKLAPLYNMNALVAVLLGLVLFGEHAEVSVVRLLAGAALIIGGATLVASA